MSEERFELSPELEECLRDLASRVDAKLLLADPRALLTADWRAAIAPPQRIDMDLAEREILRAHRAELAWLLRKLFIEEIQANPEASKIQYYFGERMPRREWERRAAAELELSPASERLGSPVELLRACIGSRPGTLDLQRIAIASLRLEDRPNARVYAAEALLAAGQPRAALRVVDEVLRMPCDAIVRKSAWESRAQGEYHLGNGAASLAAMERAAEVAAASDLDSRFALGAIVNLLSQAIELGNAPAALQASRMLADRAQVEDPAILHRVSMFKEARSKRPLDYPSSAVEAAKQVLRAGLHPAGAIANEFL